MRFRPFLSIAIGVLVSLGGVVWGEKIEADLLIVGGDESGCAAAVQAARLGVKRIVLVNDIDWLGGQFCTQGIGPMDEWTLVNGKRVGFPRSGSFQEIIDRIRAHNVATYGVATPGNSWCGTETIEPKAGAQIFEEWLAPYGEKGTGQVRILRGWEPVAVQVVEERVRGVSFAGKGEAKLEVAAPLTVDSTDWGDVIRLSGAAYMAGPDLRSRFGEPSAPEVLEPGGNQEMNPITYCAFLREAGADSTIPKPARYDARSFADWQKAPPWVDWDGSGGIYHTSGWCIYTHRRIVDRHHYGFAPGTEATILNWPANDYPLSTLPRHVVEALEQTEPGASKKNIVDLRPAQRAIVFADAKQRALEFVYWLQTAAHDRVGDFPQSFRYMKLAEDYGTPDRLPPKPYIREGLRLEALYVMREQDVRTELETPLWAKTMVPDGVFGWQFSMDFHPTRRKFVNDDPSQPWQGKHYGSRNWSTHTDRAQFPLRGLVPVKMDGLLGCSKNIGVTSMVQSALRLHGQMMHVGTAVGTVAALALKDGVQPRKIAASAAKVRQIQRTLVRGAGGPGTLLWPWQDLRPGDTYFEAANLLTIAGVWQADPDSVLFAPDRVMTRGELAGVLARLCQAPPVKGTGRFTDVPAGSEEETLIESMLAAGNFGLQEKTFSPRAAVTWSTLARWLEALKLPVSPALRHPSTKDSALLRRECVDFVYRVLVERGGI